MVNLGHILHTNTQAGDTGIQGGNVVLATESQHQLFSHVVLSHISNALFSHFIFTTRGLQIQSSDSHTEDGVVDGSVDQANDREHPTLSGLSEQHDEVDQTVREGSTVLHTQQDGNHEGRTSQQRVNCVQNRSNEQESKFDWLGDTSQEGGQGCRDHDTANLGTVFRLGRMPHGNRGSRQTVHLEHVTASQVTSGLVASDVTSDFTVDHLTGRVGELTRFEEERNVPDVVQTERDQRALNHAVDTESQSRVLIGSPMREGLDQGTNWRPYECHHDTDHDRHDTSGERDETLTGKEAQVIGQRDAVEAIEHECGNTTGDDTAKHPNFGDLGRHVGVVGCSRIQACNNRSHHSDGLGQNNVTNGSSQTGNTIVVGEAQGHTDCEDQSHVTEYGTTGLFHDL